MINHLREVTGLVPQSLRYGLRKIVFSGHADRCPICGNGISGWKPHGGGAEILARRAVVGGRRREADSCPICHGKDRTRLMQRFLIEVAGIGSRPLRVLDFAPEAAFARWIAAQPQVSYTGADLDARRYRHIDNFVEADITALPFPDSAFDVILCSHVLEHVPDDHRAMCELRRVLAPDGVMGVLVPEATDGGPTDEDASVTDPAERDRRFGQWDHVRLYARDDFDARLQASGLSVERFNPGATDPAAAATWRLNPAEFLRIARRRAPM